MFNAELTPLEALQRAIDRDLVPTIAYMRGLAAYAPLTIQVEVNNLQEVLDLLQHKLRCLGLADVVTTT